MAASRENERSTNPTMGATTTGAFTVLMLIAWQTNCGFLHRGFPHQLAPLQRGFSLTVAANRSSATATQCQTKTKISGRGRAVREAAKLKGPELPAELIRRLAPTRGRALRSARAG